MEDLEHPRVKADAARQALDDLRWLGLDWDEGPDEAGPNGPYTQSERKELYAEALATLQQQNLVYPCVCSRRDVEEAQGAPHDAKDGLYYPGTCRDRFFSWEEACAALPPGRLPAWRFRVGQGNISFQDQMHGASTVDVSSEVGDFALARDAGGAGYMLAVVVDDAAMGITEVVRGDDLLPVVPRQICVQRALSLPAPDYIHLPLVVGPDGRRLAKRHGDTRISTLREQGVRPEALVGWLGATLGWCEPGSKLAPRDLLARFSWRVVPLTPVVWDEDSSPF